MVFRVVDQELSDHQPGREPFICDRNDFLEAEDPEDSRGASTHLENKLHIFQNPSGMPTKDSNPIRGQGAHLSNC